MFLVLFFVMDVSAQNVMMPKKNRNKEDKITLGIKFGTSLSKMRYTILEFQEVNQKLNIRPAFALYIDYNLNRILSVAPEISYSSYGVCHQDYNFLGNSVKATYQMTTNYVGFKLPFVFKINSKKSIYPYFFILPLFSYCVGGNLYSMIKPVDEDVQELLGIDDIYEVNEKITTADIKEWDLSATVGVGLRFRINVNQTYFIAKFEMAYNHSFINNYGTAVDHFPKEMGERYHRSFDCMIGIGIPINFSGGNPCDFNSFYDVR